ncbi:pleiotropic regulatory protein RsmS [Moritella sp.]|uniref:pleiotropic regulatory protein RsmS n=1 Tax=Moritella sp. TaxID=78556 RepID=UPI001E1A1BD3|nr:pleiotropic regulatory protein RsmS [Moritella sp.]MCJ8348818.1 pleiotropic regulatory protein RsmS [Moritella sp.]NQZ38693.1 pleiotropic regulatory protein RsmS [Moritella sp.]
MSLENAPKHIKLAVDLIQLLEENQMPTETVVKALAIAQQDFQRKLEAEAS